ncbi:MAG: GPR1/FUN34/YaaH family transporter [Chthoniobacterales bacterium]
MGPEKAMADPAPLGLGAFALTTFVPSAANAGWIPKGGDAVVLCLAGAYGGLAQFCAGMWEERSVLGYSSEAIKDRIKDSQAKLVITADGGYRRGAIVPLKHNVDEALKENEHIEKVIIFRRRGNRRHRETGRCAVRGGVAENAERQDYAPSTQGDRKQRARHGRYNDPGRLQRAR